MQLSNEARNDIWQLINCVLPKGKELESSWYLVEKSMEFNEVK